ncbi:hypothetical protein ACTQ6A_02875 [Lachnospiraceae bacterium LCP25S3_G4]
MGYKVGDKVMVREDLEVGEYYGNHGVCFVTPMQYLLGKTVEITKVNSVRSYAIKEDRGSWNWTDEMFVGLVETTYIEKLHEVVDLVLELSEKYEKDTSLEMHKKDSHAILYDYDTRCNDGTITAIHCNDFKTDLDKFITDIKEHFAQFEVKEMTVADIEKQLGHAVKIVGE